MCVNSPATSRVAICKGCVFYEQLISHSYVPLENDEIEMREELRKLAQHNRS